MQKTTISLKQLKELGIRKNHSRKRVCDKQLEGCTIFINIGDLAYFEHGMGGWNVITKKICLSCFDKENQK